MDLHRSFAARFGRGDAPHRHRAAAVTPHHHRQNSCPHPPTSGIPALLGNRPRKKSFHSSPIPPAPPPPPHFLFIPSPPPVVNPRPIESSDDEKKRRPRKPIDIAKLEESYWAKWKPRSESQERRRRHRETHLSPIRQFVANKIAAAERENLEGREKRAVCPALRVHSERRSGGGKDKKTPTCDLSMTFKRLKFIDDDHNYDRHKRNQILVHRSGIDKLESRRNQSADRTDHYRLYGDSDDYYHR